MNYATETYTTEKIMDLINNYPMNVKYLYELKKEYYANIMGGNTALYGIEASLPKAEGSNGDPVFREVNRLIKTDKTIDRVEKKVLYIQNRWDRITDERMAIVIDRRLRGQTYIHIAEIMEVSPQRVHQIQLDICELFKDR